MRALRVWAEPLLFGLLVYLAIEGYRPSELGYNRQVAEYAIAAAAALLLLATFAGQRIHVPPVIGAIGALLLAAVAVSTWHAPSFHWSSNRAHLYFAAIVLGLSLYLTHRDDGVKTVDRYFVVIPLVHALILSWVMFWLFSIQGHEHPDWTRLPHFANVRHFGYLGFIAAACAASLLLLSDKLQVTAFTLTVAALFGIVLLGARGALVAWIVFVAFIVVFHHARARFLAFCLGAVICSIGVVHYLTTTGILVAPSLLHRFDAEVGTAFQVNDRLGIWFDAAKAISEQPWFGFGPEGYIYSRCCEPSVAQPHNFILQFLIEFGVIGTALLTALGWSMLRTFGGIAVVGRELRSNPALLGVTGVIIGFLAYAMIDGLLYHAIPLIHFALFLAMFFVAIDNSPDRRLRIREPAWDVPGAEEASVKAAG